MKNKNWTASEMGKLGGANRAKKLSKKRRSEIAKMGATARHKKLSTVMLDDKKEIC